jgi:hypothetical protein
MLNKIFVEEIDPQCSTKEQLLIEADFYEDYLKLLEEIFKEENINEQK